jgi:5'-phosphate synthase pdxT subunit
MGRDGRAVRRPEELGGLSALIIPGGESTTIGMLMDRFDLLQSIRDLAREGLPILGTCAGAILLAREISGSDQPRLGLMDMTVERNAYGRQIESFEADVDFRPPGTGADGDAHPLHAVFIRAPIITRTGSEVEVLARFEENPVVVRQGRLYAATFHPELSGERRIHALLLQNAA